MRKFTLHTVETAPAGSKEILEGAQKKMGTIPALYSVLAESPEITKAYAQLHELFANTSFDAEELTVVWQTINVEHECHYCVPAHTAIAHSMSVDPALTEALRNRGNVPQTEIEAFYAAGYAQKQVLEVVLGLSQKVISNYVNHVAHTDVDDMFAKFAWKK